jgi:hypothetical protein
MAFADRELLDKFGMEHVTLEFDGASTPIGSSHMWASARNWARFGQFYLDDGVVGGERILPEGRPFGGLTPGSETDSYGATGLGAQSAQRSSLRLRRPFDLADDLRRLLQGHHAANGCCRDPGCGSVVELVAFDEVIIQSWRGDIRPQSRTGQQGILNDQDSSVLALAVDQPIESH